MKQNENNVSTRDYFLGLDVNTDAIGFAVTDFDYQLKRFRGNSMWGVRKFNEAATAKARRMARASRRRLQRQKWRIALLQEIFAPEICKIDPNFFLRMKESNLHIEDKTHQVRFALFSGPDFSDKDYKRLYPTIYHLRNDLITNPQPHDVRLVYLALHHICKNRGHFLFDLNDDAASFECCVTDLLTGYRDMFGIEITLDIDTLHEILNANLSKRGKAEEICKIMMVHCEDPDMAAIATKTANKVVALLADSKVKIKDLLPTPTPLYDGSIACSDSDDAWDEVLDATGDYGDILLSAKAALDALKIEKITGTYSTISSYKIAQYEQHKKDIATLKAYIRSLPDHAPLFKKVFKEVSELPNYASYSRLRNGNAVSNTSQAAFCEWLKKQLPPMEENPPADIYEMYQRIDAGTFAPKLRSGENSIIPHSMHQSELEKILHNAAKYLPFLNDVDGSGLRAAERVVQIISFRRPYYIGPLNSAKYGWAKKAPGKLTPWNFTELVDTEAAAASFVERLTNKCTYTGEPVLPKNSLLYSEFCVLNEINGIRVNGRPLHPTIKTRLFTDLFVTNSSRVTKKAIHRWLVRSGDAEVDDTISGVSDTLSGHLTSYHKLRNIIPKIGHTKAEELIYRIVVYGSEKKLLRTWVENNLNLDKCDRDYVCGLKFKDWGTLSEMFLQGICHVDGSTGEVYTVMERMHQTTENLMQILSDKYTFAEQASAHKAEVLGVPTTPRAAVEDLYASEAVKRGVWQALRIVDEITDIEKGAPRKIFVEVARGEVPEDKTSRKKLLLDLYKACKKDLTALCGSAARKDEILAMLNDETDGRLVSDRLFLFYLQCGRCMYTGQQINVDDLNNKELFNIDHIFPKSKVRDNSIDNRVLVSAAENSQKNNSYPIPLDIQKEQGAFWSKLREHKFISEEKLIRLTRQTDLTEDELRSFIQREIVFTQQSAKAVVQVLQQFYPNTRIVYSHAINVDEFRQHFKMPRCTDVNDIHMAKDAYLNIVVGNYFSTRFNERFFADIKKERYSLNPEALYGTAVPGAWVPGDEGTIKTVNAVMAKNNIRYTRQSKNYSTKGGALSDLLLLKKGKGQWPVKQGLNIDNYGGYNNVSGIYFTLIEAPSPRQKMVRMIKPILTVQKEAYERDPAAFAKENWHPEARVIVERIPMCALLEIDGDRMFLTGRSADTLIMWNAYQFVIDQETEQYLKRVCRVARRKNAFILDSDKITRENNIAVYDLLLEKLNTPTYCKLFPSFRNHLIVNHAKFNEMDLSAQCVTLNECVRVFRSNAEYASLKDLCGVGSSGNIKRSSIISSFQSAYLIHQSATGLYEYRQDLLN